jgi:hypothetical protein
MSCHGIAEGRDGQALGVVACLDVLRRPPSRDTFVCVAQRDGVEEARCVSSAYLR